MSPTEAARAALSADGVPAGRTLLVASTGGHLEQLWRLRSRLRPVLSDVEWATFDEAQSRSLLAGEVVHHVPYIPPRGYGEVVRVMPEARRILRTGRFDRVVSTGSGIALAFLPVARALGIRTHYIESAARADGPSLTGRIVSRVPGTQTYSQYPRWADERWQYRGSLFDGYDVVGDRPVTTADRVVVTLGTMKTYGFRRALDAVCRVLPEVLAPGAEVLWQVGVTDASGLPVDARVDVPAAELHAAIEEADLVVAHAGIGSCLTALDAGRCPVVLPRRQEHGEHVDNHQELIAHELDRRGLAVRRLPGELTAQDLRAAMARRVQAAVTPQTFVLGAV
ncbi:UDP-N-acetylglucosamine:LPS N-acetylglucosamine transferase [Georgenia satyanarayanai]|uniref:UDP-N-acetylglucosamine:LPS N-acetylglucosamine transferase n=1 Tax=Georgenia satyanarayanai TaxID=860221 RepID=A0A2Y9AGV3_9MICO|nr:glycosyltransferase [Georgenia satyanarayanai]PYF99663.1 UDP-N-acetylglucosamine:LPS N-acetylglucosamine transferase [Georgenia satyanarayanai]SSA42508.1 UDP-N-acetylglucosamine:LPS N-acetylglucosamine transferase [Georgenia satyanarayanai]